MDNKGRLSFNKRKKEMERQKRQQGKAERRAHRRDEKQNRSGDGVEEDPDIAGIVPGPQPPAAEEGESGD